MNAGVSTRGNWANITCRCIGVGGDGKMVYFKEVWVEKKTQKAEVLVYIL
jgi:hypothetical protein